MFVNNDYYYNDIGSATFSDKEATTELDSSDNDPFSEENLDEIVDNGALIYNFLKISLKAK